MASVPDPESTGPIVAAPGTDWSQQLIKLAKTAELKKHTLNLQIYTADIVNAQASLEEKSNSIVDVRQEKNWLESERERLLDALKEINLDRERVDLVEANLAKEVQALQQKITDVKEGEYAASRATVDALRAELDLPPLPSLQETLDEKAAAILEEKRRAALGPPPGLAPPRKRGRPPKNRDSMVGETTFQLVDPSSMNGPTVTTGEPPHKRPRGRPRGSRNKPREESTAQPA